MSEPIDLTGTGLIAKYVHPCAHSYLHRETIKRSSPSKTPYRTFSYLKVDYYYCTKCLDEQFRASQCVVPDDADPPVWYGDD